MQAIVADCIQCVDRIMLGRFQCFASSPQAVTFRAELHGTEDTTAEQLLNSIEKWVESEPSISIGGQTLELDTSCNSRLGSFSAAECGEEEPAGGGEPSTVVPIIVAAVVVGVVLLLILCIIITVMACRGRRKHRVTLTKKGILE